MQTLHVHEDRYLPPSTCSVGCRLRMCLHSVRCSMNHLGTFYKNFQQHEVWAKFQDLQGIYLASSPRTVGILLRCTLRRGRSSNRSLHRAKHWWHHHLEGPTLRGNQYTIRRQPSLILFQMSTQHTPRLRCLCPPPFRICQEDTAANMHWLQRYAPHRCQTCPWGTVLGKQRLQSWLQG